MPRFINIIGAATTTELLAQGDNFNVQSIGIANNTGTSTNITLSIREYNDAGAMINRWNVFKGVALIGGSQVSHDFTFDNKTYGLYFYSQTSDVDVIIN